MTRVVSATAELRSLQDKRHTLEKAVRIAAAVEQLHQGLQAVLLMGKPTASISKKAMANFEELDEKTRIMSSTQVREILERLEQTVHAKLQLIINISEMSEAELADPEHHRQLEQVSDKTFLKDYLKKAQTAVALKVLLRTRGEITRPTDFNVSADNLKQKITQLDGQEQSCRQRVRNETVELITDTEKMMQRDDLPEAMREMISATHASLKLNLEHLDTGQSIMTMPVPIENVEMNEDETAHTDVPLTPHPVQSTTDKQQAAASTAEIRPGFFTKFWYWITTPPSVGWQDIEAALQRKQELEQRKQRRQRKR